LHAIRLLCDLLGCASGRDIATAACRHQLTSHSTASLSATSPCGDDIAAIPLSGLSDELRRACAGVCSPFASGKAVGAFDADADH